MAEVTVDAQVENIDEVMETYNRIRLYRDTDPGGSFSTLVDTETLVADQIDYTLTDSSGGAGYVYRYAFYHTVSLVQSSLSDAFFPSGRNVSDIIIAAARKARGFAGTCSAEGTVSTLIDATLAEEGLDADFLSGCYLYRPDAAAEGDWQRRLAQNPFDLAATSLTPARDWTNVPASGERYAIFPLMPPLAGRGGYSWLEACADGLYGISDYDIIDLGVGTSAGKQRYSLSAHASYFEINAVRKVLLRSYTDEDDDSVYEELDASKNLRWWEFRPNGRDDQHIWLSTPPMTDEHVMVEVLRRYAKVYRPDDITLCPFELAVAATVARAYEYLNAISRGKYAAEAAFAAAELTRERAYSRPLWTVRQ